MYEYVLLRLNALILRMGASFTVMSIIRDNVFFILSGEIVLLLAGGAEFSFLSICRLCASWINANVRVYFPIRSLCLVAAIVSMIIVENTFLIQVHIIVNIRLQQTILKILILPFSWVINILLQIEIVKLQFSLRS